jgi:hypothetical protein
MGRLIPPELPLGGGCPCQAIRFAVRAMPLLVYACHCTECQRSSGSAFGLSMPVAASSFRIVRGEPKPWRRIGVRGEQSTSWFCADCGCRIYGERDGRSEISTVRAGTLDDTSWLRPIAHVHLGSAQAWERILNNAECFDVMPPEFSGLSAKWREMWQQ